MRRGPSDERGPLRRGQLETQSGSLLERIRRGRAAALPEFEEPLTGLLALSGSLTTSGHRMEPGAAGAARGGERCGSFLVLVRRRNGQSPFRGGLGSCDWADNGSDLSAGN